MRINNNLSALNSWRISKQNHETVEKSTNKLASGLRINMAADDAAGLAISEKMRGQIRGLNQASRNIQDAISLIQTAEGALGEVHDILQRGRELCVQAANGVNSDSDRNAIQKEIDQLAREVDRISNTTEFNTLKLLNNDSITVTGADALVVQYLKQGWLEQSEKMIHDYFGLDADGVNLDIVLDSPGTLGGVVAFVQYAIGPGGKATNLSLHIDMADFSNPSWPNGGTPPQYYDRIIAHEMAHAIMGRTMDFASLTNWFKEGTAEFIQGADERLYADLGGPGLPQLANVVNAIDTWAVDSLHYSSGYAAVRYMHDRIKSAYGGTGIKDLFDRLELGQTFDAALSAVSGGAWADENAFRTDFKTNGAAYISSLNLTDADTGAIGGANADGGPVKDVANVVPDVINFTDNPLTGFNELWPSVSSGTYNPLQMQVGANGGQMLDIILTKVNATSIGISDVNVVTNASVGIDKFEGAIKTVSTVRSRFGAIQNRLEHAMKVNDINAENTTAAESRIRDTDIAKEMMKFTKGNILSQAVQLMLAQANTMPQAVLSLLRT